MNATRRNLLLLAGLAGFVALTRAAPRLADWVSDDFTFAAVDGFPDFRRRQGGAQTVRPTALVGIGERTTRDAALPANLDASLYFDGTGPAAIAYFHDYYCPVCRAYSDDIKSVAAAAGLPLSLHDYPLFGEASVLAARAAIAARQIGMEDAMRDRLDRTKLRITPGWIRQEVAAMGIALDAYARHMQSDAVTRRLAESLAMARAFGFIGTPSTIVGRTIIDGRISRTNLRRLIAREREGR